SRPGAGAATVPGRDPPQPGPRSRRAAALEARPGGRRAASSRQEVPDDPDAAHATQAGADEPPGQCPAASRLRRPAARRIRGAAAVLLRLDPRHAEPYPAGRPLLYRRAGGPAA